MKYRKVIVLFSITLSSCSIQSDFLKYSDKIEKIDKLHNRLNNFQRESLYKQARTIAFQKNSFLQKPIADTLFVLESSDFETGTVIGEIWNLQYDIAYQYRKSSNQASFDILKNTPFTKSQKSLITKWDTVAIKDELNQKRNISSGNLIRAHRCYKRADKMIVDKIYFKDFFNPKRDN